MGILEMPKGICYNVNRQKDMNSPCRTMKSHEVATRGFSISNNITSYSLPSNHLLMRWQTTPAITVTKKDMNISI